MASANQCATGIYRNVLLRCSSQPIWLVVAGLALTAPVATTPINGTSVSRRARRPNELINHRAARAVFHRALQGHSRS